MSSTNYSNARPTTDDIAKTISLYEGRGISDWFIDNVVNSSLSTDDKSEIKRNFPRMNYLKWIINRVALSIPSVSIVYQPKEKPELMPLENESDEEKKAREEQQKLDVEDTEKKAKRITDKITEIMQRQTWEGQKDFWAALPSWRVFLLLAGDTFVKLPWYNKGDAIYPERMGPQYARILLSDEKRKFISGFRFEYPIGGTNYQNSPAGENTRTETITESSWVVEDKSKKETKQLKNQDLGDMGVPFIPVAHMRWEEREEEVRGLPLAQDLMEKILHIYAIELNRRLGNKFNSAPIIVRINSSGKAPNMRYGETHDVYDKSPQHKADVKSVGGGLSLTSSEEEYKDAIKELEDLAYLPHEGRDMTASLSVPSGTAQERLSDVQVAYREAFALVEGSFLCDLFYKILILEGEKIERTELTAQYGSLRKSTDAQIKLKADFLAENKFLRQALREYGYEEDKIDELMDEREAENERVSQSFMSGVNYFDRNKTKDNKENQDDEIEDGAEA